MARPSKAATVDFRCFIECDKLRWGEMKPTLNPDGISVKGCSIIYAPAGQAGEYAALATNPYRGCGHQCLYCYVPPVIHMPRKEFDAGAVPKEDFLRRLTADAQKYQALGIEEQVMQSFTTDPYHPGDTTLTRETHEVLIAHGLGICTLSKGGRRALRDLDLFRPGRDAYACTLTSLDDAVSLKWERAAALPGDRIDTLREFHEARIFTWVSLEPVLDTEATLEIIRRTHKFVDLYKVGRVNYSTLTKTTDWRQFSVDVVGLMAQTGSKHYIKRDLQPFLPEGYDNPLRVQQFRPIDPFPIITDDPPQRTPAERDVIRIDTPNNKATMKSFDEYLERGAVPAKEGRKKGICDACGKYKELVSKERCDSCRKREDRGGTTADQKLAKSIFNGLLKQLGRVPGWTRAEIVETLQQPKLRAYFADIRDLITDDAYLAVAAVGESGLQVDHESSASTDDSDAISEVAERVDDEEIGATAEEVGDDDTESKVDAEDNSSTQPAVANEEIASTPRPADAPDTESTNTDVVAERPTEMDEPTYESTPEVDQPEEESTQDGVDGSALQSTAIEESVLDSAVLHIQEYCRYHKEYLGAYTDEHHNWTQPAYKFIAEPDNNVLRTKVCARYDDRTFRAILDELARRRILDGQMAWDDCYAQQYTRVGRQKHYAYVLLGEPLMRARRRPKR